MTLDLLSPKLSREGLEEAISQGKGEDVGRRYRVCHRRYDKAVSRSTRW